MRIAVIGSHGTGKTTLCDGLLKAFNFNFIPDVVPKAHELKFLINEKTPPETSFWVLSKQLELERNTSETWVMEKSLFDNLIYGQFSIKDNNILNVMKKIILKNAHYDLMFYCPIEFSLADDGLRSLNKNFQKKIDINFRSFLAMFNLGYIELRGNKEARLNKAINEIHKFKKK